MVQMSPLPPASASHYLLMLVMFFAFIIIIAIIIIVIILNFSLYVRNYTLIKQSMIFLCMTYLFVYGYYYYYFFLSENNIDLCSII